MWPSQTSEFENPFKTFAVQPQLSKEFWLEMIPNKNWNKSFIFRSAWIYTRASMSIAIYLPPICDPRDGHMLLDGGYCNNQPADIMKKRGSNRIITINVGAEVSNLAFSVKLLRHHWCHF